MQPGVAGFLSIADAPKLGSVNKLASVTDLATHFGVKWRSVEDDGNFALYVNEFENFSWRFQLIVADELCGRGRFDFGELDDLRFRRGAGTGALLLHQLVESRNCYR